MAHKQGINNSAFKMPPMDLLQRDLIALFHPVNPWLRDSCDLVLLRSSFTSNMLIKCILTKAAVYSCDSGHLILI